MTSRMRGDLGSVARAAETLRDLGMPSDVIREVLGTDDLEVVRRHFELQRELLEERLHEQHRAFSRLERLLTDAIFERRPGTMCRSNRQARAS
jgi:DNA-binding transcriptional MerR regulator